MDFIKKFLNKYTYLFLGLIVLISGAIFFIIPNFQTEEFNQDVIDDIIDGITTTIELHKKLLNHKKFIDSDFNVSWLDKEKII